MATPELTDDENAHIRALMKVAVRKYGSANKLAFKLGMAGSSLGKFLSAKGGLSRENMKRFAELEQMSTDEVMGHGATDQEPRRLRAADRPPGAAFAPTTRALRIARVWLKQKPWELTDEAIDYAVPDTFLTNPQDADSPQAARQALLHTIVGSAAYLPPQSAPPNSAPPEGTRRSRMRGR